MFHGWENFYFLIGSAAAGLIGLLFVVVTLTAGIDRSRALRAGGLYMTPTAFHFGAVLCTAAVAIAPDLRAEVTGAIFGAIALTGFAHATRASIGIAASNRGDSAPHWSDFWTYGAAPAAVYAALCVLSVALGLGREWAAEAVAGLLLALLVIGIRNAWDLVTWMAPGAKAAASAPANPQ
jgi:hypothetical protein